LGVVRAKLLSWLEYVLQAKLHLPIADDGGADTAEVSAPKIAARSSELRCVQKVECLVSELQAVPFPDPEFFE
jgi:hypothetical protein